MNTPDHFKTTPTKNNQQIDFLLLDGSGSMASKWWDVLLAVDTYVSTVRGNNLDSRIILSTFSDEVDIIVRDQPSRDWAPLYDSQIGMPGGGTRLFDAINAAARRLRDLDPPRATLLIATDGQEAGSQHTSETQARAFLDWVRAKGWQVIFIGVGFDNNETARALGATPEQTLPVSPKLLGPASKSLGKKRANYGLYGTDMNFTSEEKREFGGFLTDGTKGGAK